jgi:hypothetical protein
MFWIMRVLGESPAARNFQGVECSPQWAESSELPTIRSKHQIRTERGTICADMPSLRVQIVRFVDEDQPGWVESQFRDAQGEVHSIIDKVPMFTSAALWPDSDYPQPGWIECRVLERIQAPIVNLARISIEPYHVELTDERSEFVIVEADLSE